MLLGLGVFVLLAPWTAEYRTFLPLLPIACLWAGVGFSRLVDRIPPAMALGAGLLAVAGPWFLPLGTSQAPPRQQPAWSLAQLSPSAALVHQLREAGPPGAPIFTDSAVLAWRARRGALLLPDTPRTLEALLQLPALHSSKILALGLGTHSEWCSDPAWENYLERCTLLYAHPEGAVLLEVPVASTRADTLTAIPPQIRVVDPQHPLPSEYQPRDLVELPLPPATRAGLRLREEAAGALLRMVAEAREDSVELRVVSAYRSYSRQEQLFSSAEERFGEGQQWVAPPGASEHQLGTTVDFADLAAEHVLQPTFAETAEGVWLAANASRFGFVLSYPPGSLERTGYHAEPWHFRFVLIEEPSLESPEDSAPGPEDPEDGVAP
jgi:LAS superfamily LD-carboxypeptidase LdcB